jgi:uncharacterized Zn finger protein (UPF0148 family)
MKNPITEEREYCQTGNHLFVEKDGKVFCNVCGKSLRTSSS